MFVFVSYHVVFFVFISCQMSFYLFNYVLQLIVFLINRIALFMSHNYLRRLINLFRVNFVS